MGYHLHITRAEFWADNQGKQITLDEWLRYVASDPELRVADDEGFVYCTGPSKWPEPWLDWFDGSISTKSPDKPIVAKMLEIAGRLGARVQGDDGEIYTDTSEIPD